MRKKNDTQNSIINKPGLKERFFNLIKKSSFKTIILLVLPLVIGALSSALGNWDSNQDYFKLKIFLLVVSFAIYIVLLLHNTKKEINLGEALRLCQKRNEVLREIIVHYVPIFKQMASDINTASKRISQKGRLEEENWSFDDATKQICMVVYNIVKLLSPGYEDFEVTYVKLIDEKAHKIKTVGYHNSTLSAPSIFGVERCYDGPNPYYDAKMFKKNKTDFSILNGVDDVFDSFYFEERSGKKGKYSQYIGIPIFCNDKKMVGLLQIVSRGNSKINDDDETLAEKAERYILHSCQFLLLLSKVEKGLMAKPPIKEGGNSNDGTR